MNTTLKNALAEKQTRKAQQTAKIVQVRLDRETHTRALTILRKRKVSWGEFFRQAAKQLIKDSH